MQGIDRIRENFERNAKAVGLRPSVGQGTAVTKVRVTEDLTCEIEEGSWKLVADMSEKSGGLNRGPNPGILGRGAFGSCLAMAFVMWAAKLGVPYSAIDVEVQADYDSRGTYGVGDVPSGYREVRYLVNVASSAPEADIRRVMEKAETHSPYMDVFGREQTLKGELRHVQPED